MRNVTWDFDRMNYQDRVYLPSLVGFGFIMSKSETKNLSTATDLASVMFFYTKPVSNVTGFDELKTLVLFVISAYIGQSGSVFLETKSLTAVSIQDSNIWFQLQGIWSGLTSISLTECAIDAMQMNLASTKQIFFDDNQIENGRLEDILATSKAAEHIELDAIQNEAIDVALLPTETLISLTTTGISLRWTSRPVTFPNLQKMKMAFGDIDLNIFTVTRKFKELILYEIYLWNSSVSDIRDKMGNLTELHLGCSSFEGICPVVDLGTLSAKYLEKLNLDKVLIAANRVEEISFPRVKSLSLVYSQLEKKIVAYLHKLFPNVEIIAISIEFAIQPGVLKKIIDLKSVRTIYISVDVYAGTTDWMIKKLRAEIRAEMNLVLPTLDYKKDYDVLFWRNKGEWKIETEQTPRGNSQRSRLDFFLRGIGIEADEDTLEILSHIYASYVYILSILGIICNTLSVVVLVQRTMNRSTSFLLIGLSICDSLFLLTSILLVEEFQILNISVYVRSSFTGYIVYPLSKTGNLKKNVFTIYLNI